VHANLSTLHHAHSSFTAWERAASISRQSALIAWHNAFNEKTLLASPHIFHTLVSPENSLVHPIFNIHVHVVVISKQMKHYTCVCGCREIHTMYMYATS
jgi:hypothetical protein